MIGLAHRLMKPNCYSEHKDYTTVDMALSVSIGAISFVVNSAFCDEEAN
jgi:hypothetical protein